MLERIGADDRLCRYGGEAFCLLLLNISPMMAPKLAQRLLNAIGTASIRSGSSQVLAPLIASLGLTVALPDDTRSRCCACRLSCP